MKANSLGVYTFEEFKTGFTAMGVGSIDDLKRKLPQLYLDLKNAQEFKKMYQFVFDFARDKTHRNLDTDLAIDLWEMLLGNKCKFIGDWIAFLRTEKKELIVMTKDNWNMVLELVE